MIASIHNEREEFTLALHHAQHAVAVARLVGDHVLIARAEEERAIALKGQRDLDQAIGAYTNAANELSSARPGGSFFVSLIGDALHLCATSERIDLKVRLLKSVFGEDAQPGDENIHALHALYSALPRMADSLVTVDRVLPIVALSMADLLADVPQLVERRIVLQATDALLPRGSALPNASRLSAVAAILMAQSGESLTIGDVADIAESLAAGSDRIYFKPQPDGAGHWTLRLEIANGVVVSIVQLDDRPRTAITTTVLALLLSGLDHMIREQLLGAERMPRQEAIINVACRKDFERQIGSELLELGDMPNGFVVAESTDVTQSNQPPMFVVCMEQCPTPWRPNEHALSDVHLLLGEVLRILVGHLLARAVEPEVLLSEDRQHHPKDWLPRSSRPRISEGIVAKCLRPRQGSVIAYSERRGRRVPRHWAVSCAQVYRRIPDGWTVVRTRVAHLAGQDDRARWLDGGGRAPADQLR